MKELSKEEIKGLELILPMCSGKEKEEIQVLLDEYKLDEIIKKYSKATDVLTRQIFELELEHDREDDNESDSEAEKRQKSILIKIKAINKKIVLLKAKEEKELDEYYEEKRFNDLIK